MSGKSNLLEGLELDVAEVRLAGVEAVGPEILVAEFGALGGACVGRPARLERR